MILPIEESKWIITMIWSKLIQRLDFVTSTMSSFFFPSNTNKFIAHILFSLKRIVLELIDYPL